MKVSTIFHEPFLKREFYDVIGDFSTENEKYYCNFRIR